jgi:hypothetical protein
MSRKLGVQKQQGSMSGKRKEGRKEGRKAWKKIKI